MANILFRARLCQGIFTVFPPFILIVFRGISRGWPGLRKALQEEPIKPPRRPVFRRLAFDFCGEIVDKEGNFAWKERP